ncbi:hypothetical protein RYB01_12060 [Pseudomonas syringae]|nr:hypothetical protein [Pseudomonas syringae]
MHVTFSYHCYSRKYSAEKHPAGEPIIILPVLLVEEKLVDAISNGNLVLFRRTLGNTGEATNILTPGTRVLPDLVA